MQCLNNYVLVTVMEEDNSNDLIIDLSKKDYNVGKVVADTDVYITNDEKTTLEKDDVVLYRKDRESYKYKDNTVFIPFNSIIAIE